MALQSQLEGVAELIAAGADFYCVVDCVENVRQLGRFFAEHNLRLAVLIELGVPGGGAAAVAAKQP